MEILTLDILKTNLARAMELLELARADSEGIQACDVDHRYRRRTSPGSNPRATDMNRITLDE